MRPIGLFAALALLVAPAAHAQTVWDMHINFPAGNFDTKNAMRFAEEVEQATDGDVVINVKAGGSLGLKGPEVLAAVRDGIVPIAHFHLDTGVGEAPFLGIQGLPYLTQGFEDAGALHELALSHYKEIMDANDQEILYAVFWPGAHLYTKAPISSVDDLANLKIRTANKSSTDFFEAIGAAPVLMPWADALVALASGGLDGIATSATSGVDGKFWEFMDAVSTISYVNPTAVVTVSKGALADLSDENRAAVLEVAARLEPEFQAAAAAEDTARLADLTDAGMDVSPPSADLDAALKAAGRTQWEAFAADVGGPAPSVLETYRDATGR